MVKNILVSTVMVAGLALSATSQVKAQTVPKATEKVERPFSVKLGVYFPTESGLRDEFGNTFFSYGLSYDIGKSRTNMPIVYSAYLDGATKSKKVDSQDGHITYTGIGGQFRYYLTPPIQANRVYAGAGLGAYFINAKTSVANGQGGFDSNSTNKTEIGGKIFAGYEFAQGFFGEANYTYVSKVLDTRVSGLGLSLGYRF